MTGRNADYTQPSSSVTGYTCEICHDRVYHPTLVYGCEYGHYFCQSCYSPNYYEGSASVCPYEHCKTLTCRMDKRLLNLKTHNCNSTTIRSMFPCPEQISRTPCNENLRGTTSYSSFYRGECEPFVPSRKPINCPYPGCKRTIAVTGLDSHFKYEHTAVAYINTYFGRRNNVAFNPYNTHYNRNLCIVMINLMDDMRKGYSSFSLKASSSDLSLVKPVMLVMASKIPYFQLSDSDADSFEEEFVDNYESCATDKILVWVVANVPKRFRYALALSTPCKTIRLKYCGIISQVHEDRIKLCEEGKGLILSSSHVIGMTDKGKKSLTLDIIVFPEDTPTPISMSNSSTLMDNRL